MILIPKIPQLPCYELFINSVLKKRHVSKGQTDQITGQIFEIFENFSYAEILLRAWEWRAIISSNVFTSNSFLFTALYNNVLRSIHSLLTIESGDSGCLVEVGRGEGPKKLTEKECASKSKNQERHLRSSTYFRLTVSVSNRVDLRAGLSLLFCYQNKTFFKV